MLSKAFCTTQHFSESKGTMLPTRYREAKDFDLSFNGVISLCHFIPLKVTLEV